MLAASPGEKGWTPSGDTKNDGFGIVEEDKDHQYKDDEF